MYRLYSINLFFWRGGNGVKMYLSVIRLLCQDSFSFTCCIRTLQCFSHTQFCIRCLQNIYNVLHHVWTLEVRLAVRHLDRSPPPQHEPPFWFLLSCSSWARGLGVFLWWILFKKKKKPSLAAFEVQTRWRLLVFIFKLALFSWFYWFFFSVVIIHNFQASFYGSEDCRGDGRAGDTMAFYVA